MSHPVRKFPGHFAGAFISRVDADSKVEILVIGALPIEYREADQKLQLRKLQVKMPGGCAVNHEENENLPLTVVRELCGEIAKSSDFHVNVGEQIFRRFKSGRSPGEPKHQQSFYCTRFEGELRTDDMVEDEGDEVLTPPSWIEARELSGVIFFSHREPLIAGLERLARDSSEIAHRYSDILATYRSGQS